MKTSKLDRVFLVLSVLGFLALAASFSLMPFDVMGFLPGVLFWAGLLIGVLFQILLEARRRAMFRKYDVKRQTMQKPKCGLLTFGSNTAAKIVDVLLLISVAVSVVIFIVTKGSGYSCFFCISAVVFTFIMHFILNGRNFFHVKNQAKVRQALEQRKGNSAKKGEEKV